MLTVYEHNESVCCQKVRLTLEEKDIEHTTVNISFEERQQHTPEFLALNPKGCVPVIVHDGRVVTESTVITEYLDDAFPGQGLMPKDAYWRARRRQWARWIDDEMHIPHISTISFNISFTEHLKYKEGVQEPGPRGNLPPFFFAGLKSDAMLASLTAYQRFLAEMDRTLAEHDWLAGPEFSLADIDVAPYIWRLKNLRLQGLWKQTPRIQHWLDRVSQRPSFQNTIVATALPDWIRSMNDNGEKAWPVIKDMLQIQ